MKFVNQVTDTPREQLLSILRNSDEVNRGVSFDENRGKPRMLVKSRGNYIAVTCRYVGGASRDNGYIVGTVFLGRITEKEGRTKIGGVITTAPIYHLFLLLLSVYFVYQCITLGGINPIPIILVAFSLIMFREEFRKQGVIARYIARAVRKSHEDINR